MKNKDMIPQTMELPLPQKIQCPYEKEHEVDVIVVGCGFAGLNAAVSAKENGKSVLVIDKGRPGYSGLSPWPSSFRWFDPERGDIEAAYKKAIQEGGDYISNLNWYDQWIKESKSIYQRLTEWGILVQYPKASEAGDYFEKEDFVGYREVFENFDRHLKWIEILKQYEIPFLEHTMVTELLTKKRSVHGVVALHVQSCEFITIHSKAVVLATGGGSYKPTGYPTGGDTFDGEYMAYQIGLPIAGKEFEDFHSTPASAPGNVFIDNHWQYLENIWLCGGDITPENAQNYAMNKGNVMALERVRKAEFGVTVADGSAIQDISKALYTRRGGAKGYASDEQEVRSGKMSTPTVTSDLGGAAVGMCCHLTSGIFCGLDELDGHTSILGLFVAGDGTHATCPSGASYPCGVGFTSCFTSIDGMHAGKAAANYAKTVELEKISRDEIQIKIEEMKKPLFRERGFDSNWARDILHSIMAPYWVTVSKTEATLSAALIQVEYMRDHVIPFLTGRSGHDLRLCIEMKHKVLSAEMKLRASMERKESRGNHFRADIPFREDDKFLCYILMEKDADGTMKSRQVTLPKEWTGDRTLKYENRYHYYFPGEPEKKGFVIPTEKIWSGGKRG